MHEEGVDHEEERQHLLAEQPVAVLDVHEARAGEVHETVADVVGGTLLRDQASADEEVCDHEELEELS